MPRITPIKCAKRNPKEVKIQWRSERSFPKTHQVTFAPCLHHRLAAICDTSQLLMAENLSSTKELSEGLSPALAIKIECEEQSILQWLRPLHFFQRISKKATNKKTKSPEHRLRLHLTVQQMRLTCVFSTSKRLSQFCVNPPSSFR